MDYIYILEAVWVSENYRRTFVAATDSVGSAQTYVRAIEGDRELTWTSAVGYSTTNMIDDGDWRYYYVVSRTNIFKGAL